MLGPLSPTKGWATFRVGRPAEKPSSWLGEGDTRPTHPSAGSLYGPGAGTAPLACDASRKPAGLLGGHRPQLCSSTHSLLPQLAEGANAAYFQLLSLFAYGTYPDYLANKDSLPELTPAQKNKLKHLTIVSLAARMKCIPYSVLLKDLEMRNLRELEDLIIEAVYTDIIQGKLDQRNQLLEVDFCIGRDIQKKDINTLVKTLQEWCDGCEAVLLGIEQQVLRANQYKENFSRTQQQVEAEVTNIKKTLKATASSSAQEIEQQLAERECPPHAEQRQPTKKMSKVKGLVSSRH
ncbi:COP9 signalosome complex subunit 7b [Sarcophilus harrisii]|nr:COP9 signalosome complex subunit 7b [Sarcophilus harrisii]